MKYSIMNVRPGNPPRDHIIYAELWDEEGHLVISATVDYILNAVKERGYELASFPRFRPAGGR